jgi:hypothetical protein
MKRSLVINSLCFFILIVLSSCQSKDEIEIKMKSEQKQKEMLDSYTYEDYKRVYDKVVTESKKINKDKEILNKWIIRTLATEALYYENDLSSEQVVNLAQQKMEEHRLWVSYATEHYGIQVNSDMVDKYITDGPDKSSIPQHLAYADALGITLKDLNHTFDRDLYEKNVIWLELKPLLEKEYGTISNNELIKKYEKAIRR